MKKQLPITIQVVIDLHRDEMAEETRLVMDLDGRPTARFMFFNGLSRTKKTGNIAYLYNENLQDNLAFSFQMQMKAAEYYPGLTRRIYLKGYRYTVWCSTLYPYCVRRISLKYSPTPTMEVDLSPGTESLNCSCEWV